ncbi:hypothetical protein CMK11_11355, partial [Candidatus Poribacteria bacterium]|nr:hypothetical protein [Candidatus Poribacteria bacterium]
AKQKQKRSTEKYLAKIGSSVCIGRYAGLSALRTQMDAHLTGAVDKLRESGWVYCDPPASAHDAGANLAATPTPGGAPFPFPQRRPPDSATADRQMTRLSDTLVEQVDGWHNERKRAWDPGSVAALLGRTATAARQAVGAGLPDDACVTCVFLSHVFNGIIPNCQKLVAPTGAARAQLTRQIDVAFTLVRRAADALAQPAGVAVGEIDLGRLLGEGAEPGAPQQAAGDDMARVGPARRPRSGPEEAKRAHSLPDVALVHRGLLDHREDNTYTLSATARELLGAVTIPAEGP